MKELLHQIGWLVAAVLYGMCMGAYLEREALQHQAITHHAATYEVNDYGETTFKWKE